jgi:PAS domain S-box-containing protein
MTRDRNISRQVLNRLRLWVVLITLVSSGVMIWHNWTMEQQTLHRQVDEWTRELKLDLDSALKRERRGLQQTLQVITAQPALRQALAQGDVARMQADWAGAFEKLRAESGVTHFYFVGADRTCLLRLHLPQRGDLINRYTMLEAERTGKAAWGVEMGITGVLTLRVVQPVFEDGRLIGYVELGREVEPLLSLDQHGYVYAVLLHKAMIDRASWETGMQMLGREHDWERLPQHVIEFAASGVDIEMLRQILSQASGDSDTLEIIRQGRHWDVSLKPLQLVSGEKAGILLAMRDATEATELLSHRALMLTLMTLVIVGFLLVIFSWVTRRLFNQVVRQESELLEENTKNRAILHHASDGIHILDGQGNLYEASNAFCAMLGYSREELIGQHVSVWDALFSQDTLSANLRYQMESEVRVEFETRHRRKDGEVFDVEVSGIPVWIGNEHYVFNSSRDITARKQAQDRLYKSEQDLKDAQRLARIGNWELDILSDRLVWSDEIYRIFEIDPDRFGASYEAFLEGIHPDDREVVNTAYADSLVSRKPYSIRHRLRMKDGRIKYVHEQCETYFDANGEPLRSVGTVQDVTEQVETDMAIEEARNLLQAVIDHIPLRVYWKDLELNYLGCNPAFAEDAGYARPEDLIGRDDYQMAWKGEAERNRSEDREIIESGIPLISYEISHAMEDGRSVWLRGSKVPMRNSRGKAVGVMGIYQDVTGEKAKDDELIRHRDHLEQLVFERTAELGAAQGRYQQLVDDIGDDFLVFSFTTDNVLTYLSNGFESIFGFPKEEAMGRSWAETIQWLPDDLEETGAELQAMLAGHGDRIRTEMRFDHPDGRTCTIDQTCHAVMNSSGEVVSVDGILTDITGRKRNEEELLKARRAAEAASQAKSVFLANMSHEIRTPMNGVIGMLEILSHSPLPNEERKMVGIIRRSARSLLGIIDDILDFSKIEAGKLSLLEQGMSLEDEMDIVVGLIDRIAMDRQVDLTVYFDPELPQQLIGDGLRVRQILTNLAGNAVKFSAGMERIGRVHMRTELKYCGSSSARVLFTIEDNGIGMDAETLARLFQPFEQADSTTTRKFGGTGLGLSISRTLASMMDGEISARSEPGQGSVFTVSLPFQLDGECPNPSAPYDLSGLHCIIVADDSKYVDDYTRYLTHAGARVDAFGDLEAAWDFVAKQAFDRPACMIVMEDPGIYSAQEIVDRLRGERPDDNLCFVQVSYLSVERGKRRKVRRLADDIVQIDREALTRRRFLEAVAASVGRVVIPREQHDHKPIGEQVKESLHILVAEDNEVNRDVIHRQLEMLGHSDALAVDGAEAFQRWEQGGFDLLLTDLHMPGRDGYELTSLIRDTERQLGLGRMPIIALTANAMKGEEERCLVCGMDAYLSKPIELDRLRAELDQWLPVSVTTGRKKQKPVDSGQYAPQKGSVMPVFDPAALTKMVGSNPAVQRRLLERFLSNARDRVEALLQAVESQDAEAVGQLAHSLKSAARSMGGMRLGDLCERMEHAGKAGDVGGCTILGDDLAEALENTVEEIQVRLEKL